MTDFRALNTALDQLSELNDPREKQKALGSIWEKVKEEKHDAWGIYVKGRILMMLQKPPHFCVMYFYKAIEIDPTLHQAMSTLGLLLRLLQKYPEALAILRRADETVRRSAVENDDDVNGGGAHGTTSTDKARCATDLGCILQVMGDQEAAEKAFRRAMDDDNTYLPAHMSLAVLQEKMGDLDASIQTLQSAVDGIPEPATTKKGYTKDELQCLFATGVLYSRRDEWQRALDIYERAWKYHTDKWNILCKIIQCHAALKNIPERNDCIRKLYSMALSGKIPSDKYCREQILTPQGTILVFEMFMLAYDKGLPIVFMQWEKEQPNKDLPRMVSMGSNEAINQIERDNGQLPEKYRLYHVDAHATDGSHSALQFLASPQKPTYDEVRQIMLDGMLGIAKPVPTAPQEQPLKEWN
jgi:tetratricopeptide (TPR) repeat protein